MNYMLVNKITGLSSRVYKHLGAGYSERVYHNAMEVLLRKEGLSYETERIIPIEFEGHVIGNLRADLIVENELIVELKAVKSLTPAMTTQAKKYLHLLDLSTALLVNFPPQEGCLDCETVVVEASDTCKESTPLS